MADALRREFFPTVSISPEVIFTNGSFLGCISHTPPEPESLVCLHEILNSPDVPEQVFRHILTHELIHLVVAPQEVDGQVTTHPPVWRLESDLCPDRSWIWDWLWEQFGSCLMIDRKNECIKVKRDWRRRHRLQCRSLRRNPSLLQLRGTTTLRELASSEDSAKLNADTEPQPNDVPGSA